MSSPEARARAATRQRARYAADPESHKAYARAHYHEHKEERNPVRVLKRFGMTQADYDTMLEGQSWHCACCPATAGRGKERLHVDHDHASGRVRGLLCSNCNTALGLLADDPQRLQALVTYLTKEPAR